MANENKRILVTGGAGFIGSHITDALLEKGHEVWVYDNLDAQVHGENATKPDYLNPDARFIQGDVRDRARLAGVMADVDVVYHQAAAVGVGQSMYDILRYTEINTLGGATVLDILANEKHHIQKVIVASSMSIYGEGQYLCPEHGVVYPKLRPTPQLADRDWEVRCPRCGVTVQAQPTDEDKPLFPTSVYAINKRDHEEMFLSVGRAYNIPTVALRYFNVYGTRQALSNPYTGVAAIFSGRLLNGNAPLIFEDGLQSRDFTHVSDIVQANLLALESDAANYEVFNVGTGRALTVKDVAEALAEHLQVDLPPTIVEKFREGDIRHCYADISKIQQALGYEPKVRFEDGVEVLVDWVRNQTATDHVDAATQELERRGLAR
ncbi:MAG: SDR family NAD(P)-dependent oxidoreductase [Litorilinea sp.]